MHDDVECARLGHRRRWRRRIALISATVCVFPLSSSAFARDDSFTVTTTYQTIENFGASDAWIAQDVGTWNLTTKNQIADLLFSTDKGIGLSCWRFNIGAGVDPSVTLPERTTETFEVAQNQYDWTKQAGQRWFLQAAKARGVPQFFATVYSPTMRMTKNGHVYCDSSVGTTNLKPGYEQQYAKYLVDVLKHFQTNPDPAERIDFNYISPVNEPQWDWNTPSQEGNRASVSDIKSWVNALASEMQSQGVNTQMTLVESGQIQDMYGGKNYISNFAGDASVNSKIANRLSYHSYFSDDPTTQLIQTRQAFAAKMAQYPSFKAWETEYCILGSNGPGRDLTMTTALNVARVIHYDLSVANVSAWQWWLAMSPHDYKDGLIYVDDDSQTYSVSKTFWALGNYSRFIRPGAKRISFAGDNSSVNGLLVSAYRDDVTRQISAVYVNETAATQSERPIFNGAAGFKLDFLTPYVTSDKPGDNLKQYDSFNAGDTYDIPPKSVVTFVSGTLNEDNTGKVLRRMQGSNNFTLGSGVLALSPGDGSFGGVLSGAGGLEKSGSGLQILSANNIYTGPTSVTGGTLALAGSNLAGGRLSAASAVTISAGGAIVIQGFNALGGYTITNIPAVTINNGGTLTTADTITCNLGSITLSGGTVASGLPNSTWGSWTLNQGIRATGNSVSTFSATRAQLRQQQEFVVDAGAELHVTGTLEDLNGGTGSLIKAGPGTLVLSGSNSYTGGTTVGEGTLVIAHPAALGTGPLNVVGG